MSETAQQATETEANAADGARVRRWRRRYLVNRGLQLRYIGVIVALDAVVLAVIAWAVFVVIWKPLLDNIRWSTLGPNPQEVFAASVRQVTITTLALFVLFGVLCAAVGLLVSHGVAGPLVQMKRAVRAAARQERYDQRVRLRRGDSLHDFADELNDLLSSLEDRQREQREVLARVADVTGRLAASLERGDPVAQDVLDHAQELEGLVLRAAART